jgi:hypothetical protein
LHGEAVRVRSVGSSPSELRRRPELLYARSSNVDRVVHDPAATILMLECVVPGVPLRGDRPAMDHNRFAVEE